MSRTRNPLHLSESPLILVLAQVRFAPILAMADYIPKIQESFRDNYPYFRQVDIKGVIFGPEPSFRSETRWKFVNKNKSSCITLSNGFVTLATNSYDRFEGFVEDIENVLSRLHAKVKIAIVERLGLRYVDLVRLSEGETFSDYFENHLIGFQGSDVGAETSLSKFEFMGTTKFGKLVIRCTETMDGTFLPPDLVDMADSDLEYDLRLETLEKVRILDFDHFDEDAQDFLLDRTVKGFWQLHDNCELAFRNSVTDRAMDKWGAEEVDS